MSYETDSEGDEPQTIYGLVRPRTPSPEPEASAAQTEHAQRQRRQQRRPRPDPEEPPEPEEAVGRWAQPRDGGFGPSSASPPRMAFHGDPQSDSEGGSLDEQRDDFGCEDEDGGGWGAAAGVDVGPAARRKPKIGSTMGRPPAGPVDRESTKAFLKRGNGRQCAKNEMLAPARSRASLGQDDGGAGMSGGARHGGRIKMLRKPAVPSHAVSRVAPGAVKGSRDFVQDAKDGNWRKSTHRVRAAVAVRYPGAETEADKTKLRAKRGQVPEYLLRRKAEQARTAREAELQVKAQASAANEFGQHSQQQKEELLEGLQARRRQLLHEYQKHTHARHMSTKRAAFKEQLESELDEVERFIAILQKPNVIIDDRASVERPAKDTGRRRGAASPAGKSQARAKAPGRSPPRWNAH